MPLRATVTGIGFWHDALPGWDAARAWLGDGQLVDNPPRRPSPQLLAANERRRAPDTVALALDVALAACNAAGQDPAQLPSVFASTHGELSITDYMGQTLASDPRAISPTRFHNSVHNAAAGYWTIGAGCHAPATAISAFRASFAEGLLEALVQLRDGAEAVLLVAYDGRASGPLAQMVPSEGLLGGALVLARDGEGTRLRATLVDADIDPDQGSGALHQLAGGNAMAPMLPLFQALADGGDLALLHAGPGRGLRLELAHG